MKKQQIAELLSQGKRPAEIRKALKVSRAYVHRIQSLMREPENPLVILRKNLPWHILKAAEKWDANIAPETPMTRRLCEGCKREMYTRDAKLEDICEECAYAMMEDVAQKQQVQMQQSQQFSNPFDTESDLSAPSGYQGLFGTGGDDL